MRIIGTKRCIVSADDRERGLEIETILLWCSVSDNVLPPHLSASSGHKPITTQWSRDWTCAGFSPTRFIVKEMNNASLQPHQQHQQTQPAQDGSVSGRKRKESSSSFRRYRPFHCPYCTFSFDRKCNLACHLKTHGVGRGRVTCPEEGCGKEYGRQADVNRHIRNSPSRSKLHL